VQVDIQVQDDLDELCKQIRHGAASLTAKGSGSRAQGLTVDRRNVAGFETGGLQCLADDALEVRTLRFRTLAAAQAATELHKGRQLRGDGGIQAAHPVDGIEELEEQ